MLGGVTPDNYMRPPAGCNALRFWAAADPQSTVARRAACRSQLSGIGKGCGVRADQLFGMAERSMRRLWGRLATCGPISNRPWPVSRHSPQRAASPITLFACRAATSPTGKIIGNLNAALH